MRLINLQTDLRSLRYGNDQFNGGSSGQPFITTPIPKDYIGSRPDFLLRQGALGTTIVNIGGVNIPIPTDSVRISKFLDSTNGRLFILKQTALERQNPSIPGGLTRIYNPFNTVLQAENLPLGFHLNKQGENAFALSYAQGGTDGYFVYTLNKDLQEGVSRLSLLYGSKMLIVQDNTNISVLREDQLSEFNISNTTEEDDDYSISYNGGPNSIGGIGRTRIKLSGKPFDPRNRTNSYTVNKYNGIVANPNNVYAFDNDLLNRQTPKSQGKKASTALRNISDYRATINRFITTNNKLPSTNYSGSEGFNREDTYGTSGTVYSIRPENLLNPNSSVSVDVLNATPIIENTDIEINDLFNKDLAKFFFEVIDPNVRAENFSDFLFFRAYINDIGDNFKGEWQPYKYVGRAENFYKYTGFSRDISLSFTIYAHSRDEMIPLYEKLNRLLGTTAPRYLGNDGYMTGNFIRITVGDYFNNLPGIINNINIKPSFEAGWDINRDTKGKLYNSTNKNLNVGQIPRMIEVDMTFTPIHDFTPEYGQPFIRNLASFKTKEISNEQPAVSNEGTNTPLESQTPQRIPFKFPTAVNSAAVVNPQPQTSTP
jgi:hypothetical protein